MTQRNAPPGPHDPARTPDDGSGPSPVQPTGEAGPRKATFARPITPTTPFSPENAAHQAMLRGAAGPPAVVAPIPPPQVVISGPMSAPAPPGPSHAPAPMGAGMHYGAPAVNPFTAAGPPPAAIPAPSNAPAPAGAYSPHGTLVHPPHAIQPSAHQASVPPLHVQHGSQAPVPAVLRADHGAAGQVLRAASTHVVRSRAYALVLDRNGQPVEIGSGRFGKAYLGEERWLESKTDFRREVVIKILQKGVGDEDILRFQMEKELLERVQGHPNIVRLYASGEAADAELLPPSLRDKVEPEFVILEKLEMSLEERLKGSRTKGEKDDLLAVGMQERIFRVLDYMIPISSAVEFAHLVKNISHRDIKPANILIALPDPALRGSALEVRLADFNVAKVQDEDAQMQMTRLKSVPGTLFFQSPEQETNVLELLVNVTQGSPEVEYFEDFYIQIAKNDVFALYNRGEQYPILHADRVRKKIVLTRPWREGSEGNVRARVQKSVGRPADIYSLGALFYYLISGAYANPKTLYDNFHKFIEYERAEENNTIEAYLEHEYSVINSLRAPKNEAVAPADRFFSYKHYLDGNGELIDPHVMKIIAKCMIRNKPDSYCQAHDVETRGISDLVQDLIDLYTVFGVHPSARPQNLARMGRARGRGAIVRTLDRFGNQLRWMWLNVLALFGRKR